MPPSINKHHIPSLLSNDVANTLGQHLVPLIDEIAASAEQLVLEPEPHPDDREGVGLYPQQFLTDADAQEWFDWKVIEDFQQRIHDERIDISWPACPRHPNHPLNFDNEKRSWCCPKDGAVVAPLGALDT